MSPEALKDISRPKTATEVLREQETRFDTPRPVLRVEVEVTKSDIPDFYTMTVDVQSGRGRCGTSKMVASYSLIDAKEVVLDIVLDQIRDELRYRDAFHRQGPRIEVPLTWGGRNTRRAQPLVQQELSPETVARMRDVEQALKGADVEGV